MNEDGSIHPCSWRLADHDAFPISGADDRLPDDCVVKHCRVAHRMAVVPEELSKYRGELVSFRKAVSELCHSKMKSFIVGKMQEATACEDRVVKEQCYSLETIKKVPRSAAVTLKFMRSLQQVLFEDLSSAVLIDVTMSIVKEMGITFVDDKGGKRWKSHLIHKMATRVKKIITDYFRKNRVSICGKSKGDWGGNTSDDPKTDEYWYCRIAGWKYLIECDAEAKSVWDKYAVAAVAESMIQQTQQSGSGKPNPSASCKVTVASSREDSSNATDHSSNRRRPSIDNTDDTSLDFENDSFDLSGMCCSHPEGTNQECWDFQGGGEKWMAKAPPQPRRTLPKASMLMPAACGATLPKGWTLVPPQAERAFAPLGQVTTSDPMEMSTIGGCESQVRKKTKNIR